MRALFFILLMLNVVYFAWQLIRSPSDVAADMSALKDIEPIVLLSEVKAAKEAQEKAAIAKAGVEELERKKLSEKVLVKDVVVASAEVPNAEKKLAPDVVALLDVDKKKSEKVVVDKAIKSKVAKGKVIKNKITKDETTKDKVTKDKKMISPSGQCFTVGPFRDLKKLRGLTRAIKSYVVEADFRGKEETLPPLYWVYTAAEKTKKLTLKTAARLRAKNVNDFYIINSDRKVNSISLGRFRSKKGVQKFVKKLERWGFDVIVEVVRKDVTIYWLDYQLAAGSKIPKSVFRKFKPSKKQAASHLSRQCN